MKRVKHWIRNHFGFSQKETNGFIVIIILMVVILFVPSIYKYSITDSQHNYDTDKKILDSLVSQIETKEMNVPARSLVHKASASYFYFDPNSASEKDLEKIFGKIFSKRIVNYRTKGGRFIIKSDLLKIYNLPENIYKEWEKFILLPIQVNHEKASDKKISKNYFSISSFDINKADSMQLEKIKGIGAKLSVRILKYKNKLGGFVSEDQYAEIFGLDSNVLNELKKYCYIEKNYVPIKMNVNTASLAELSSHPYIGRKNASVIINYRNQHGSFQSLESLKAVRVIEEQQLKKMTPYLIL